MIRVRCYTSYLTRRHDESGQEIHWQDADYNGKKVVDAVKGNPINKYAMIPHYGGLVKLEESNRGIVTTVFGRWGAKQLRGWFPSPAKLALVPIPGSSSVEPNASFVAQGLAQAVADHAPPHLQIQVADVVRLKHPKLSAHSGGTRDPDELLANMRMLRAVEGTAILIDDVFTTGGHLRAVAQLLRRSGVETQHALCVAETVHKSQAKAFDRPELTLDDA